MARPKLCGIKLTCKLSAEHEGSCDFGLSDIKIEDKSELDLLKEENAKLRAEAHNSSPEALQERVAAAEFQMARYNQAVREMAEGCRSSGMTILASQLVQLFDR